MWSTGMKRDAPRQLARDVAQVLAGSCAGRITRADAGAQRRERLLAHAADRQHAAAQRHLAGHRDVVAHARSASRARAIAVAIATPADGPSFGIAPAGTCTCTSWRTNSVGVEAELARRASAPR